MSGDAWHSVNNYRLRANEFRLESRFTVVQKHFYDFLKIYLQLIKGVSLAVRSGEAGNVSDVELGIGAALYNRGESMHGGSGSIDQVANLNTSLVRKYDDDQVAR